MLICIDPFYIFVPQTVLWERCYSHSHFSDKKLRLREFFFHFINIWFHCTEATESGLQGKSAP